MVRRSVISAAAVLALAGCRAKAPAPVPPPPAAPAPLPSAAPQRSDVACAAPLDAPGAREKLRAASGQLRIGALTESGLPVLAVAGNREIRSELDAAENELRKKGARIVDLSHTRVVDLGDAVVYGLPGAFERRQLHSDGACIYVQKDIDALAGALDPRAAPAVVVAAVPPRGQDAKALDVSEGQNLGDPRLGALLKRAPFGIFGQVWESGGRAIDASGRPVRSGVESDQLYLNPGPADHTPWPVNDGTIIPAQAALLTIHGKRASWEPVWVEG